MKSAESQSKALSQNLGVDHSLLDILQRSLFGEYNSFLWLIDDAMVGIYLSQTPVTNNMTAPTFPPLPSFSKTDNPVIHRACSIDEALPCPSHLFIDALPPFRLSPTSALSTLLFLFIHSNFSQPTNLQH